MALPVILYHHSRSLWLSIDHIFSPSEKRIAREVE
jgi:hypothetical protein